MRTASACSASVASTEIERPGANRRGARRAFPLATIILALLLVPPLVWGCEAGGGAGGDGGLGEPASKDTVGGGQDTKSPADVLSVETGPPPNGSNHAPVLHKIGDKVVAAGDTLAVPLSAEDADGDALTFSMFGQVPLGAAFDKDSHEFTWTPKADKINSCAYVTFVVSDGTDFDRETVQICVTEEATPHPPAFVPIASQYPVVGQPFRLQLEATDQDGDTLTYSIEGAQPDGAKLDAASGEFAWTPTAADVGAPVRIRFQVSDGGLQDALEVLFFVQSGGSTTTNPPKFQQLPAQQAEVGQLLSFVVEATDADSDPLVYSMRPGAPLGASFSPADRRFSWTPTADQAARAYDVTFEVFDGTHNAFMTVEIAVGEVGGGGGTGTCEADRYEPNDTSDQATALVAGTAEGLTICDSAAPEPDKRDVDWFRVPVGAGETLSVSVQFSHIKGDIDAQLFVPGVEEPVAVAQSSDDNERIEYRPDAPGDLLLAVYGYTGGASGTFANTYSVTVALVSAPGCSEDVHEDNDTEATATALTVAQLDAGVFDLQVCANDVDWYRFDVGCGARIEILVTFAHANGDLDAYLFGPTGEEPLASGESTDDDESLLVEATPSSGPHFLLVTGYPKETTENRYDVIASISAPTTGCTEDPREPNDSAATASPIQPDSAFTDMALCCGPDWFRIDLQAGDVLLAEAQVTSGDLRLHVVGPDGATVLATSSTAAGTTRSVESPAVAAAGSYYIHVEPQALPSTYEMEVIVIGGRVNPNACTTSSCPLWEVCNAVTGECEEDWCDTDADCPGGYVCRHTFCVDTCSTDADCRSDYRCKGFEDGRYCAPVSSSAAAPGAACESLENCQGEAICWDDAGPGFCAEFGCRNDFDCPGDALCGLFASQNMCLRICFENGDCLSEALTCRGVDIPSGGEEQACVP